MLRISLLAGLAALLFPFGPTRAQEKVIDSRSGDIKVETLVSGLDYP
jgi:hypothetical protein